MYICAWRAGKQILLFLFLCEKDRNVTVNALRSIHLVTGPSPHQGLLSLICFLHADQFRAILQG